VVIIESEEIFAGFAWQVKWLVDHAEPVADLDNCATLRQNDLYLFNSCEMRPLSRPSRPARQLRSRRPARPAGYPAARINQQISRPNKPNRIWQIAAVLGPLALAAIELPGRISDIKGTCDTVLEKCIYDPAAFEQLEQYADWGDVQGFQSADPSDFEALPADQEFQVGGSGALHLPGKDLIVSLAYTQDAQDDSSLHVELSKAATGGAAEAELVSCFHVTQGTDFGSITFEDLLRFETKRGHDEAKGGAANCPHARTSRSDYLSVLAQL